MKKKKEEKKPSEAMLVGSSKTINLTKVESIQIGGKKTFR